MIQDANQLPPGTQLQADVCVIGSGAAGIPLALEFVGTRHSVVVLESGGLEVEERIRRLLQSDVVGVAHSGWLSGRARAFGGTTRLWGGQAIRLDPLDFRVRPWVPYSGWPITRSELDPFYCRAERVLKLRAREDHELTWRTAGIEHPPYDKSKIYPTFSHWSPSPDFALSYGATLRQSSNVRVVLYATATRIGLNTSGTRVDQVDFATLEGRKASVRVRFVVVCCGGIDTPRLLLLSSDVQQDGIGNLNDLVGRFFQEHLFIRYGDLRVTDRRRMRNLHEPFFVDRLKYAPKLAVTEEFQERERILNVYGDVVFEAAEGGGALAAKTLMRTLLRRQRRSPRELARLAGEAALGAPEVLRLAYRYLVKKRAGAPRQGPVYLGGQGEQAPNPRSRIMLGDEVDQLGLRRARIDWQLTDLDRRSLLGFAQVVLSELNRLSLASFDSTQLDVLESPTDWVCRVGDSGHHMGTARMHESPRLGVVDASCRVHGVPNLFIGSSAVFPTSGHSNPTLTIIALCVRISDALKCALEPPEVAVS